MKYFKFILIFILGLFLIACEEKADSINDVLDEFVSGIPKELDKDYKIPSTYVFNSKKYNVTVESLNKNVLSNGGEVVKGFKDIDVSIKITLEKDKQTVYTTIPVTIIAYNQEEIKELLLEYTNINSKVTKNLDLPLKFEHNLQTANLVWTSSNQTVITNDGKVNFKSIKQVSTLSLEFSFENINYSFKDLYNLEIEAILDSELLQFTADNFTLPSNTNKDISLPSSMNGVALMWSSSHKNIISDTGKFKYPNEDTSVEINATFYYKGNIINKKYTIVALSIPHEERLNLALSSITFPSIINTNLNLKTSFEYNVTGTWKSNNPDIVTDNGLITLSNEEKQFSIILTLKSGGQIMEKEFNLLSGKIPEGEVYVNSHHHIAYATNFDTKDLSNLVLNNDRIKLTDNALTGTYTSPVYKSNNFSSLVGSWAAISSKTATAELKVRVRVNGTWSSYLSYGSFGLGLQNKMFNQNGGVAKLSDDEVIINDSKTADAFQYQVILKRDSLSVESPKLSLVSVALQIPGFVYNVDISSLPKKVEYDLPNLYQIDVPTIGNSICSPTSSTMLLMYHGHTFEDNLPHREVANLFKEYNSSIFGNWVFNTVGMSAYGENTYVKRIYSFEELLHHLATVGPVALSIKGNTGLYTTNGHLLVVSGYEITNSGRTLLIHDPNVKTVEVKYSESIYNGFTRNIIYVMENK